MPEKRYQLNPGTILDNRYVIHGVLGEGGFGITYDARNRHLGTRVAIKELFCGDYMSRDADVSNDATLFDSRVMERFEKDKKQFLREAHILKSFTHEPGIVSVMDFFESNNTAYIVMNFLDGTTLREFVESTGPMNYKALLMSFKPLLEALQKVHNAGLVHGDISPDNIMLLSDGSLRLIDFGASYKYDKKTSSYVINVGKSGYSAPEQYSDESLVGPRADIYSISATLFYCMTSKDPESSISRMLLNSERMAPSDTGIDIPKEVDELICMGLSIKPEGRFSSAIAMKEAMNRTLTIGKQAATQARNQSRKQEGKQPVKEQRVEKKTERKPQISRPIIIVVAAIAIGTISFFASQSGERTKDGDALFENIEQTKEEVVEKAKEDYSLNDNNGSIQGVEKFLGGWYHVSGKYDDGTIHGSYIIIYEEENEFIVSIMGVPGVGSHYRFNKKDARIEGEMLVLENGYGSHDIQEGEFNGARLIARPAISSIDGGYVFEFLDNIHDEGEMLTIYTKGGDTLEEFEECVSTNLGWYFNASFYTNDSNNTSSEKVNAETKADMPPEFARKYSFTSGAGAWETLLQVYQDGSFEGYYYDQNLGVTGEDYPNGELLYCEFTGKFKDFKKVDDRVWSAALEKLDYDKSATAIIENGVKIEPALPYGLEEGYSFKFIAQGASTTHISERDGGWYYGTTGKTLAEMSTIEYYTIYNLNQGYLFVEDDK